MKTNPNTVIDSHLARTLLAGTFAVTAEITPPISGAPDELIALAEPFRGVVDALNVTDGPRAMVHMSGLAGAAILVGQGLEPILQFTCRDRNRIALQSDLLGASALGVRNVLILRGDEPDSAELPAPKAVFDVESRDLIHLAAKMRDGEALASGREIVSPAPSSSRPSSASISASCGAMWTGWPRPGSSTGSSCSSASTRSPRPAPRGGCATIFMASKSPTRSSRGLTPRPIKRPRASRSAPS